MKISIILGVPQKGSFNHAIAETAAQALRDNGYGVTCHDLYAEGFNPLLPPEELAKNVKLENVIKKHCDEITQADGIIIIHPNWWGQPPAILKGWIDRVLRQGVAYEFATTDSGEGVPKGLLKAKTAIVFNTANTPEDREMTAFGDPLETLWKKCIFDFCGVEKFVRRTFSVVIISSAEQRREWLNEVRAITQRHFPATKSQAT
ncbi:MAG TPA: NAD(P)H-dependent oxidoreductase [Candidatus Omnitrophota bacterium]|nr:NAD(P)H-dependent oxidoreductase [Candidatus Omnitrophota bacterium]HPD85488.1 NAD(P)H-dependent oxidoreductase [Candidatus Omnitrophota bacterium]HRZ04011.1 NAD(P)H-dependent oxidoreductase [Candidatus Omnitrophota bacterium]